jgi:hypothetical protein
MHSVLRVAIDEHALSNVSWTLGGKPARERPSELAAILANELGEM